MALEIPTIACFEYPKNGADDVAFEFHCLNTTSHEFIVTTRSDCAMTVNEETGAFISPGSPPSEHRLAPGEAVQIGDVLGWELDGVVAFDVRFTRTDNGCFSRRNYALHHRSHPCQIPGRTEPGQLIESNQYDIVIAMLDIELRQQIRDRNQQQIRSLLARGADADYRDQTGYPPIFLALGRGSEEVLRLLLECGGAAVNGLDPNNIAPLHRAAGRRSGALALLLAHGAEIDSRTPVGETPLMWAINARRAENAILLLANGADPSALNLRGERIPELIAGWGDHEVSTALDQAMDNHPQANNRPQSGHANDHTGEEYGNL